MDRSAKEDNINDRFVRSVGRCIAAALTAAVLAFGTLLAIHKAAGAEVTCMEGQRRTPDLLSWLVEQDYDYRYLTGVDLQDAYWSLVEMGHIPAFPIAKEVVYIFPDPDIKREPEDRFRHGYVVSRVGGCGWGKWTERRLHGYRDGQGA